MQPGNGGEGRIAFDIPGLPPEVAVSTNPHTAAGPSRIRTGVPCSLADQAGRCQPPTPGEENTTPQFASQSGQNSAILRPTAPRRELSAATNVHFEDHIVDGKIEFDYIMRDGVVKKSNALDLMRSVGLEV